MGISRETKAMGVSKTKQSGVEPLRRSYVNSWHLPAAPAAKLVPSVMPCTTLDPTCEAEMGSRRLGNPGPPYISPRHAPWRVSLYSRLTATAQHGRQQFTGYKSISIGVEKRTPRVAFDGGRVHCISLDSYCPPLARQPLVS